MKREERRGVVFTDNSPFAKLKSVPLSAVRMDEGFWKTRMRNNIHKAIPAVYKALREYGYLENFIRIYQESHPDHKSDRRFPLGSQCQITADTDV